MTGKRISIIYLSYFRYNIFWKKLVVKDTPAGQNELKDQKTPLIKKNTEGN